VINAGDPGLIDAQRQLALAKRCHERQSSTHPAASSHPDRRAAFFLIDAPYLREKIPFHGSLIASSATFALNSEP